MSYHVAGSLTRVYATSNLPLMIKARVIRVLKGDSSGALHDEKR